MRLRRLGWAGLELESAGERIVIDLLVDPGMFAAFLGDEPDEFVVPDAGLAGALLTHLHRDHADVGTVDRLLRDGEPILRPRAREMTPLDQLATGESEQALAALARPVHQVSVGDAWSLGPFTATAVDAVDGLGSPQVSWVVTDGQHTIVHGGDTLWHGRWWHIAAAQGPFDVAFLPANGVLLEYPQFVPSVSIPAAMTPLEAVEAARALKATTLVPVHFNATFEHHYYHPRQDAGAELTAIADEREQHVALLSPGEWVDVADLAALRAQG